VIIIAGESHVPPIIAACGRYREEERERMVLIPEPLAKNTAPAILCGALYSRFLSPEDRPLLVLTSDHIIRPLERFTADAAAAAAFARQDRLVVFGIPPTAPETGFGYIQTGEALPVPDSAGRAPVDWKPAAFRAASFREKPDRETAEDFLSAGNFYWNSGMFAFSPRFIIEEFRRIAPDLLRPFDGLRSPGEGEREGGIRVLRAWEGLGEAYAGTGSISFDYAVAEKCTRTVMIAAGFAWQDVGSWDEYAKLLGDRSAEVYRSDAEGCFVDADIPVALCGVKDLLVVVRSGKNGGPPAVLISGKGKSQKVREIVEQIKAAGRTELL
jgi:mannose-1-phosphate guanylyltransferase/mannose-1-phosphate guanylyltransferase/mannose-6-phosphate isomerase